jgi:hypothetical protein
MDPATLAAAAVEQLHAGIKWVDDWLWGPPMLVLL